MNEQQALQVLKNVQDAAVQRGGIFKNTEEASQSLVAFKKIIDALQELEKLKTQPVAKEESEKQN